VYILGEILSKRSREWHVFWMFYTTWDEFVPERFSRVCEQEKTHEEEISRSPDGDGKVGEIKRWSYKKWRRMWKQRRLRYKKKCHKHCQQRRRHKKRQYKK
jgi:hypothetical protein